MVKIIRYILFPFSVLYGMIVGFRNFLFEKDILKSSEFDVKTIQVGNLSAGGTGKSPHVEYIIRLLHEKYKIATLSRGYGRKKTGYIKADETSTASDIGDEPLQFYNKFEDITVHVDAKRVDGIVNIMSQIELPDVIVMDDAYQHRAVKAGFSILLTDYSSPFYKDFMLPTGNLREFPIGKKRSNVIIVTKCPDDLSTIDQSKIEQRIKPNVDQNVFFSRIKYGKLRSIWDNTEISITGNKEGVLVTGIANPIPLVKFLEGQDYNLKHLKFPDHHLFTDKNIQNIITTFSALKSNGKVIITTEKDAMRLKSYEKLRRLPIHYLDIEIKILDKEKEFNEQIYSYVTKN